METQKQNGKLYFSDGIGRRIKESRKRAGLTLDAVAAALGVTSGAISRWESESSLPSRGNLKAFSDLVDANLSWLQTGNIPPDEADTAPVTVGQVQTMLRMKDDLRRRLVAACIESGRSQNSEICHRLERSFWLDDMLKAKLICELPEMAASRSKEG